MGIRRRTGLPEQAHMPKLRAHPEGQDQRRRKQNTFPVYIQKDVHRLISMLKRLHLQLRPLLIWSHNYDAGMGQQLGEAAKN